MRATTWRISGTSGTFLVNTGERGKFIDKWEIKKIKLARRLSRLDKKQSEMAREPSNFSKVTTVQSC